MKTKFRALSDEMSPTWFYGDLIYDDGVPKIKAVNTMTFKTCLKGTEGQFIGIHDKNGKEIYKYDLIRYAFTEKINIATGKPSKRSGFRVYRIGFKNGCFTASVVQEQNCYYGKLPSDETSVFYTDLSKCEIIGNIHQNN